MLGSALALLLFIMFTAVQPVPALQGTLPPTWTPIPTATATPLPTRTLTPSPTVEPSPTATIPAEVICETFEWISVPPDNASLTYVGFFSIAWQNSPPDSIILLAVEQVATGEELLFSFPQELNLNSYLEMPYLPDWGSYNWTASLYIDGYGALCPTSGTFFREPWWDNPIIDPLAPPFIFGSGQ
jgi:hypothetical protein